MDGGGDLGASLSEMIMVGHKVAKILDRLETIHRRVPRRQGKGTLESRLSWCSREEEAGRVGIKEIRGRVLGGRRSWQVQMLAGKKKGQDCDDEGSMS